MTPITVTPVTAADWPIIRQVRIQALEDAPYAFGQTLAAALEMPDEEWQTRAKKYAEEWDSGCFLAFAPTGEAIGMAGTFLQKDDPTICALWGMWVHPNFRRLGAGALLIRAAEDWARSRSARRLNFWVALANPEATAFYERLGYTDTGARSPMSSDPCAGAALYARDL